MPPRPISDNTLFYGDNLVMLREYFPDESVDLIYLDPPFNPNRSYNVLFKDGNGMAAEAQITAFDDTWHRTFCGCGTAVAAAQKLGRRWAGIDITHLAISLIKYRLRDMFPSIEFKVIGEPVDLAGARQLAAENRYQFQWWALSLVNAQPVGGQVGHKAGKKGTDRGIEELLRGKRIEMLPEHGTFKQAPRADQTGQQHELGL